MKQPDVCMKKLKVSKHAIERAIDRFGCKNEQEAITHVRSKFGIAKYIGETTCEQGQRSHMYCNGNMGIYVSLDLMSIKTVIELESHGHFDGLRNKIEQMYLKEFRKADRHERSRMNKQKYINHKNEAEIANLKFRIFKTRSQNVKNECESLIVKLQNEIQQCEFDIKEAEFKKRQLARAIATVV